MKYCKDCIHYHERNDLMGVRECKKREFNNMVTGGIFYFPCADVRADNTLCGPDAKWFEQKVEQKQ